MDADDDSLISSEPGFPRFRVPANPRLIRTPPPTAIRLDVTALAFLGLMCLEVLIGPALPFGKRTIPLPPVPILLALSAVALVVRHVMFRQSTARDTFALWRERLERRPHLAAAVRAFAATRPAVFVVAYLAVVTFGTAAAPGVALSPEPLANLPARFDAGWYGSIAVDGYQWDRRYTHQANIAFFPALPALMRPVGQIFGSRAGGLTRDRRVLRSLWAGVFISLAAFFVSLIYLARLSRLLAGPEAAAGAPMLLAAYPFAIFFNAPYTEGLFLLGAVGAFYCFQRERWVAASLFGLLVGLSRPNGCLVAVPLAILGAQSLYRRWKNESGTPDGPSSQRRARGEQVRRLARAAGIRALVAAMPGLGMLAFTAYLYWITGVWFAWARMQVAWGRTWGVRPLAQGWEWLTTEGLIAVTVGVPFDTLNTVAVIFVLAMFWSVLRRLGVAYATFVALNLVPPIFTGGALSMGRTTSTLFPVFIALAAALPRGAVPVWATAFAVLQGLAAALFFTWRHLF